MGLNAEETLVMSIFMCYITLPHILLRVSGNVTCSRSLVFTLFWQKYTRHLLVNFSFRVRFFETWETLGSGAVYPLGTDSFRLIIVFIPLISILILLEMFVNSLRNFFTFPELFG